MTLPLDLEAPSVVTLPAADGSTPDGPVAADDDYYTDARGQLMPRRRQRQPLPFRCELQQNIRIDADTECWIWTKHCNAKGYGVTTRLKGRPSEPAHRWVWKNVRGDIPPGLHLDHLCRVRSCVNPDHLEPVTPGENTRRSREARGLPVVACPHGMAARYLCRPCERERDRRRWAADKLRRAER